MGPLQTGPLSTDRKHLRASYRDTRGSGVFTNRSFINRQEAPEGHHTGILGAVGPLQTGPLSTDRKHLRASYRDTRGSEAFTNRSFINRQAAPEGHHTGILGAGGTGSSWEVRAFF